MYEGGDPPGLRGFKRIKPSEVSGLSQAKDSFKIFMKLLNKGINSDVLRRKAQTRDLRE